ncbi:uncharacterized protein LOC132087917 [Daphnia carinata]|uniref:uncharacterized protein LOC132087917 n=1 Tax=Daphnia carinata TaxID=120202 RepID=UPI002868B48A|nr:uncharacterized protein LOC132087917 [Daphnia carinata]
MAGHKEKYRGATKYLSDRARPSEASQVLICRAKSRKVRLNLQTLISQDVPRLVASKDEVESSTSTTLPTHMVVGVTYGAEAYCVLALESGEDAREKDEEYLSEIASKMAAALHDNLDFCGFKDLFNAIEKKQLTRIKCRLYTDLPMSPFQECSVFDTFKECHKLIEQVRKGDIRNKTIVPIAVRLCPLKDIMGPAADVYPEYQNVDPELVTRCCRIWEALDGICAKSVAIRASLRQFEKAIDKYQQLVQKALGRSIVEARQTGKEDEIEKVVKMAENHTIFKPSRLERWLRCKQAEYEMSCQISSITDINCLANNEELKKHLEVAFDKKYSLVLSIPPLDEHTNKTLEDMKEYVATYKKLAQVRDDENTDDSSTDDEEDDLPWHMLKHKQGPVLTKIHELVDHLENNKDLEKNIQCLIVFDEALEKFGCHYSVYHTGNLLKDNLSQLPAPPTDLRIYVSDIRNVKEKPSSSTIRLEWKYADLGLPCFFLVEYRLNGGKRNTWNQKKTTNPGETQIAIPYKMGSEMEFRVAAETCIGRSEFSQVVNTVIIRELNEHAEATPVKKCLDSEEDILQSTSLEFAYDETPEGWKEADSTSMRENQETLRRMDRYSNEDLEKEDRDDSEKLQEEDKTTIKEIEQHITEMVVLESGFQVGDLYDYCGDRILTGGRKYVESSKIGSAVGVENNFSLEFKCSDSSSMINKVENMELDEHFQASFLASLTEKPRSSSKYLSNCCSSSQAAQVLISRVKSKVVRLDLQKLTIQDVAHLYEVWKKTKLPKSKSNPTHIVVGVTYGGEAYCVLTQDLEGDETDDCSRDEAEQYLSQIANKMSEALDEKQNLPEFKAQFNMKEKKQLGGIKCNLYGDFETITIQGCNVFDAYKHNLKFIELVEKSGIGNKKSIPIAVSLCPLGAIMGQDGKDEFNYHDVDPELISRCASIWDQLDKV